MRRPLLLCYSIASEAYVVSDEACDLRSRTNPYNLPEGHDDEVLQLSLVNYTKFVAPLESRCEKRVKCVQQIMRQCMIKRGPASRIPFNDGKPIS